MQIHIELIHSLLSKRRGVMIANQILETLEDSDTFSDQNSAALASVVNDMEELVSERQKVGDYVADAAEAWLDKYQTTLDVGARQG